MCNVSAERGPHLQGLADDLFEVPMADHQEVVRPHHRFKNVVRCGKPWDLSHLDPFAFRVDPGLGFEVTVVVLFSSHCFTRSVSRDGRPKSSIPVDELFDDGRELRVLCERRYELSKRHLPALVRELRQRSIQIARDNPQNFVSIKRPEGCDDGEGRQHYVMFFEVVRDTKRKGRLLMQIQSAYSVDASSQERFRLRRRIAFLNLLKLTSLRRRISG
ncbi:hypothetical protein ACNI65_20010 [Roseateles sp. So40a]|uniref:hypothetical protein n=1 Tax=Roseateles sp. So40a TaxID=3400226 RepID=UPI003A88B2D7